MALELIDEPCGLWACRTEDLNPAKRAEMVSSWKDGEGPGNILVFCDDCGRIVINRDRLNVSLASDVIRLCLRLMAIDEQCKQIRMNVQGESIHTKELIEVVYHAILERYALKMEPILKLQYFSGIDRVYMVLRRMAQSECFSLWASLYAYHLGGIEGIRAERARRRRKKTPPCR